MTGERMLAHHVAFEDAFQRVVEPLAWWIEMIGAEDMVPVIHALERDGIYRDADDNFTYALTGDNRCCQDKVLQ